MPVAADKDEFRQFDCGLQPGRLLAARHYFLQLGIQLTVRAQRCRYGSRGIDCGGVCTAPFVTGGSVTLTASPDPGSVFTGWSAGGCSGTGTCTVMVGNQTVVAIFDPAPPDLVTLTVNKQGGGDGTVTSDPAGISCGPSCGTSQASCQRGTTVTLTATADQGSSFNDWHGGPL